MLVALLTTAMFFVITLGLAWPLAVRLSTDPAEQLGVSAVLSLLGVFILAWTIYICALPPVALAGLPLLTAISLAASRQSIRAMLQEPDARGLLVGQCVVTAWCVGWLALVVSYSGGGWAGDWYEHWERSRFFIERLPHDTRFLGHYTLTARPPLVNVNVAAFLHLTRADFAHYQLFSTLFATLAFLPAALLALRWGGRQAIAVLTIFVMVNPLFVQNATFAWTKLPAAFFVLTGFYFFLRTHDSPAVRTAGVLCGLSLGAGMLAHYSAGPYVLVLAVAWIALGWRRHRDPEWWRGTVAAGLAGAAVLASWFGWSLAVYGTGGTFLDNPSIASADTRLGGQLVKIAMNLVDTLVPHFMRDLDTSLIAQRSAWGAWRDWFFQSYQVNLPLAFGSVAWVALGRALVSGARNQERRQRMFWVMGVTAIVLLGVGTHGARDHWGLAHICLQGLIVLGLAFLAARWAELSRGWRVALIAGGAFDFLAGIALHFGVQSFKLDAWFGGGRPAEDFLTTYNWSARMNLHGKIGNRLLFFSDVFSVPIGLVLVLLMLMLAVALQLARASGRQGASESVAHRPAR